MSVSGKLQRIAEDVVRAASVASEGSVLEYVATPPGGLSDYGYASNPTAVTATTPFAGILVHQDVVSRDLTAFPENHQRIDAYISGVASILKVGGLSTDQVVGADTFGPGSGLYVAAGGLLTTDATSARKVGHATSAKDAQGFVAVWVDFLNA